MTPAESFGQWSIRDMIANVFLAITLAVCTPAFAPDILVAMEDAANGF